MNQENTIFVVYNPTTMKYLKGTNYFTTERSAKAALTKAVNLGTALRENFKVGTPEDYAADDFDIEVTSAYDGKTKCTIRKSVHGTTCDPSREAYWTM